MKVEKLYVRDVEGEKLSTLLFVPQDREKFQLVVAHGFRGRKENSGRIEGFAAGVTEKGGSVLAFDFGGSGESRGEFRHMTLSGQARDLTLVLDFAAARSPAPTVVLGRSFGGSSALAACAERKDVKGLILWSAPVLPAETFNRMMPDIIEIMASGRTVSFTDEGGEFTLEPGFARDLKQWDLISRIRAFDRMPLLVVHGEDDETVDPANAGLVAREWKGPLEMHLVAGADHRFTTRKDIREELTIRWLDRWFGRD